MESRTTAQVAGESFSLLTGLDLVDNHLDEESPQRDEPSSVEKSEIYNEYRNYEELLPWPSVEKGTAWWADNSAMFHGDKGYLAGSEITLENLNEVLKIGTQTQRYAATLELARIKPNDSVIDTQVF